MVTISLASAVTVGSSKIIDVAALELYNRHSTSKLSVRTSVAAKPGWILLLLWIAMATGDSFECMAASVIMLNRELGQKAEYTENGVRCQL